MIACGLGLKPIQLDARTSTAHTQLEVADPDAQHATTISESFQRHIEGPSGLTVQYDPQDITHQRRWVPLWPRSVRAEGSHKDEEAVCPVLGQRPVEVDDIRDPASVAVRSESFLRILVHRSADLSADLAHCNREHPQELAFRSYRGE